MQKASMPVSPIPPGYHTLTPYLIVVEAVGAFACYAQAFNARERMRLSAPGGTIGHAEIEIGDSRIMLADESPAMGAKAPGASSGSPVSPHRYVPDAVATMAKAVAAGATVERWPGDKFSGDRPGSLLDPFGHT
jgi:PhnB protein